MIEFYLNVASAVIIPALSLIVTAIGLRNDIRKRRDELLVRENNRREQFNSELLTERNTRHDEVIKYLTREVERVRDELDDVQKEMTQLRVEYEKAKTELSHVMELLRELRNTPTGSHKLTKSEDGNDRAKI